MRGILQADPVLTTQTVISLDRVSVSENIGLPVVDTCQSAVDEAVCGTTTLSCLHPQAAQLISANFTFTPLAVRNNAFKFFTSALSICILLSGELR